MTASSRLLAAISSCLGTVRCLRSLFHLALLVTDEHLVIKAKSGHNTQTFWYNDYVTGVFRVLLFPFL